MCANKSPKRVSWSKTRSCNINEDASSFYPKTGVRLDQYG